MSGGRWKKGFVFLHSVSIIEKEIKARREKSMYTCDDPICDPCCDFCWFCVHGQLGEPLRCERNNIDDFADGIGYCNDFRCSIHEERPIILMKQSDPSVQKE